MGSLDDVFVEMLHRAADRLGAYGYVLTGSSSAGEELVQAAIVKVYARAPRVRAPEQAEAYVRRAMRTMHVDAVRREVRWRRAMPGQVRRDPGPDVAQAVSDRHSVMAALARLSPQKRTAVVLRYYDDLSYPEIADAMRVSVGTVKRYVSDAVALLGQEFDMSRDTVDVKEGGGS